MATMNTNDGCLKQSSRGLRGDRFRHRKGKAPLMPALSDIAIGLLVLFVCGCMVKQQVRIWRNKL